MVISHRHQFIFFAVPKTGSQSIRLFLRKHLDKNDWEQSNLLYKSRLPFPEVAKQKNGHITALQIKPHLDKAVWNKYYKFAFVRNPWDRFISFCAFLKKQEFSFEENPKIFMEFILNNPKKMNHLLIKQQHKFICDANKTIMINFVGKMENMDSDMKKVCSVLKIPFEPIPHVNSTPHKNYKEYYNDDLINKVGEKFSEDISIFNYRFS